MTSEYAYGAAVSRTVYRTLYPVYVYSKTMSDKNCDSQSLNPSLASSHSLECPAN